MIMQQVITVELDHQLLQDVDTAIKKSIFRNRTHLIEYYLQKFAYEKKLVKHKAIIQFLIMLLGFTIIILLVMLR